MLREKIFSNVLFEAVVFFHDKCYAHREQKFQLWTCLIHALKCACLCVCVGISKQNLKEYTDSMQ